MARNYAALFHEYLEEMADLTDAEFGRLARALLVYSRTGEFPALNGNERLFKRRVIMQEDRAQESYVQVVEKNRSNGQLGGRPRKPRETHQNPEKPNETKNNPEKPNETKNNPEKPNETQNNPEKHNETQNNPDKPTETQKTQIEIESEIKTEINTPLPNGNKGSKAATPPTREARFSPPSLDEVRAYIAERGSSVDAQQFIDFYACKGWMVGKNRMKDWKAAVRTWEQRRKEEAGEHPTKQEYHVGTWL